MFSYLLCFFTFLHCIQAGESAWGNWPGANTVTTVTSSIVSTSVSTATIVSISTATGPGGQPTTVTVSQISTVPVTIYTTVPTTFVSTVVSVSTITSNGIPYTTTISGPTSITTVAGLTSTTTITGPTSITAITTTLTSVTTETLNNGQTTTLTKLVVATFYSNTTGFDSDSNSQLIVAHSSSNRVLIAAIAIAVIVGFIVVVGLAICLACCCIRRRRRRNGEHIENNFWGGAWGGGWAGGKGGSESSASDINVNMSQANIGGNIGGTTGNAGAATAAAAGATAGAVAGAGAGAGAATGGARGGTNLGVSNAEIDERRTTVISIQNVQELNLFGAQADNGQHQRSSVRDVRYTLNQNQAMEMIAEAGLAARVGGNRGHTRNMDSDFSRCRRHSHSNCSCRFSHHNRGDSLTIGFTGRHMSRYSGSGRSRHRSTQIEDVERQDRYKGWVEVDYEEDRQETRYMTEEEQRRTKRSTIYDERGDRSDNGDEVSIYPPSSTSLRLRSYQSNAEESTAIFKALRSIGDTMDLNEMNIHTHGGETDLQLEEKTLSSNWMESMNEDNPQRRGQIEVGEVREIDSTVMASQNVQTGMEEISTARLHRRQGDVVDVEEVISSSVLTSRNTKGNKSQVIERERVEEFREVEVTKIESHGRQIDAEGQVVAQISENERSKFAIDGLISAEARTNYGAEGYTSQILSTEMVQLLTDEVDVKEASVVQLVQEKKGIKSQTRVTVTELEDSIVEIDETQQTTQHSRDLATKSSEFTLVEGGQINRQLDEIEIIKSDAFASTRQAGAVGVSKSRSSNSTMSGISNDSTQIGMDVSPQTMKSAISYQSYGGSFAARRYSGRSSAFMKSASSGNYETSGISQVVKPVTIVEVKEVDNKYDELY